MQSVNLKARDTLRRQHSQRAGQDEEQQQQPSSCIEAGQEVEETMLALRLGHAPGELILIVRCGAGHILTDAGILIDAAHNHFDLSAGDSSKRGIPHGCTSSLTPRSAVGIDGTHYCSVP